jgi:hypothetical protein
MSDTRNTTEDLKQCNDVGIRWAVICRGPSFAASFETTFGSWSLCGPSDALDFAFCFMFINVQIIQYLKPNNN